MPSETVEVPLPPRRPDALSGAVAYASLSVEPAAAGAAPGAAVQMVAVETVQVPLPPRRPAGLGSADSEAAPAQLAELRLSPQAEPAAAFQGAAMTPAAAAAGVTETVDVPLPPRRPSIQLLAAATPRRAAPAVAPVREATAIPVE